MDFLEGIGDFMRREGLDELEIRDGDRVLLLRRATEEGVRAGGLVEAEGCYLLRAPMSGVARLFPAPGEPPYVSPGERRAAGETLFCIEAMKHLNEVCAPRDLEVLEVLVEDQQPVEEGVPVMRVRWEEDS